MSGNALSEKEWVCFNRMRLAKMAMDEAKKEFDDADAELRKLKETDDG